MFLHQPFVEFQDQVTGIPARIELHLRGLAEPSQCRHFRRSVDLFTQRARDRLMHGNDRPFATDVHRRQPPVGSGPHHHFGAVGGFRGVLDEPLRGLGPGHIVGVRLIGLEQGEFGIMAEVHALVAEGPPQFEDLLHATDAEPLEVQLRRDTQIQIQVVRVDVCQEGTRVGSAVHLLQNRCFHL
ncbi:Uncharacterised protein [Mycobacteroides abscessus]|nr:Uncharacterised protein [Mycobacteroides abscessus]